MNKPICLTLLASLTTLFASQAQAQVCSQADQVQGDLLYLRRLSLDLRGRLPDLAELSSVITNGGLDPAIVDAYLASEDFVAQMRRHHRDMLWTNVDNVRLQQVAWILRGPRGAQTTPYWVAANNRSSLYRGGQTTCDDVPAQFDPVTGAILTTPDPTDPNIQREGYVLVRPYWDPAIEIKVCAFDAQTNLMGTDVRGNPADCSRQVAKDCGCGPALRWCASATDNTSLIVTRSLSEQLLRYVDNIVRDDRPYSDVVLGKSLEIDGPIAFWLRNQAQTLGYQLPASPEQNYDVPDLAFDDTSWTPVTQRQRHAGVLTLPGYLLKFQSNRGRANRFYNAFMCQHFESNEPIPPATDACHLEPDLTKRCGCKGCHLQVEPAAAYFGRWAENGVLPLEEPTFPRYNPTCARGRTAFCNAFYFLQGEVTDPIVEGPYVGVLRSYMFADAERQAHIDVGPEALAQSTVDSGRFASCTVERMWRLFMARDPRPEESVAMGELSSDFASDYQLRRLVKTIVTRPEYREGGLFGEE